MCDGCKTVCSSRCSAVVAVTFGRALIHVGHSRPEALIGFGVLKLERLLLVERHHWDVRMYLAQELGLRPKDEPRDEPVGGDGGNVPAATDPASNSQHPAITIGRNGSAEPQVETPDDDSVKPLPDRLITELTEHRTLALRDALANDPVVAFAAVLHALCLGAFYRMSSGTCLDISPRA
jgi:hypothetical protein